MSLEISLLDGSNLINFRPSHKLVVGPLCSSALKYEALVDNADELFKTNIRQDNAETDLTALLATTVYV